MPNPENIPSTYFIKFLLLALMLVVTLVIAMVTATIGPWYLAWLMGTTMIVLISVAGAILFDYQEEASLAQKKENS